MEKVIFEAIGIISTFVFFLWIAIKITDYFYCLSKDIEYLKTLSEDLEGQIKNFNDRCNDLESSMNKKIKTLDTEFSIFKQVIRKNDSM